jgi:hypothetical protein
LAAGVAWRVARRLLSIAAREADIVGVNRGLGKPRPKAAEKIARLRAVAGSRIRDLEVNTDA